MEPIDPFQTVYCIWPGGAMSYVEHAGLASFQAAGYEVCVVAFTLPLQLRAGVHWVDAWEYVNPPEGEIQLAARATCDRLRFAVLRRQPGALVVDPGIYRLAPLTPIKGRLFAWADDRRVGTSLLALPEDSATLAALAPRADGSDPGALGAAELSRALLASGEGRHALPRYAVTPVPLLKRHQLLTRTVDEARLIKREAVAIDLHAPVLRRDLARTGGVPDRWSLLGRLMARFGVCVGDAPLEVAKAG